MKRGLYIGLILLISLVLSSCNTHETPFYIGEMERCFNDMIATNNVDGCGTKEERQSLLSRWIETYYEEFEYPTPVLSNLDLFYVPNTDEMVPYLLVSAEIHNIPITPSNTDYFIYYDIFNDMKSELEEIANIDLKLGISFVFLDNAIKYTFTDQGFLATLIDVNRNETITKYFVDYRDVFTFYTDGTELIDITIVFENEDYKLSIQLLRFLGNYHYVLTQKSTDPSMNYEEMDEVIITKLNELELYPIPVVYGQ